MSVEYSYPLGTLYGRTYKLTVRVSPDLDRVVDFAVAVRYEVANTAIQVARIDSPHSEVHFDRLYRRDRPKDSLEVDVWEAEALLVADWRRFARSHERAHGSPDR